MNNYLFQDEEILKEIIPDSNTHFTKADLIGFLTAFILFEFSFFIFIILIKVCIESWGESAMIGLIPIFIADFVFIYTSFKSIKNFINEKQSFKKKTVKYIITNQRVCIINKNDFSYLKTNKISDIKIFDCHDNVGTIYISTSTGKSGKSLYLSNISNPYDVYEFLYKKIFNKQPDLSENKIQKADIWYNFVIIIMLIPLILLALFLFLIFK